MKKYHYVYRISNIELNKHYYGVRSSNIEPIKDIWFKYFSSASDQQFINDQKNNPHNYKYVIVSIFNLRKEALELEIKLHNKFNVGVNPSFYNKSKQASLKYDTTGTTFILSKEARNKISKALKDKPKSKTHIENVIKNHGMRGKKHNEISKKMMSINTSGEKNPMYCKKHTIESINKMKESSKNPSDQTRRKMREGWKKRELIKCPNCGIISNNKGNMNRWHMNNCKKSKD